MKDVWCGLENITIFKNTNRHVILSYFKETVPITIHIFVDVVTFLFLTFAASTLNGPSLNA
jgi:hypothetical protein